MDSIKFTHGEITDFSEELCTLTLYHGEKRVYLGNILKAEIEIVCEMHKNITKKDEVKK